MVDSSSLTGMTPESLNTYRLDQIDERMVPETADQKMFWEHIYRYRFAARFVKGKRVLDIACGEGYGAQALLECGAAQVIGIDVSETACGLARQRYGLPIVRGDAGAIPLSGKSVEVIVSFETLEHLPNPDRFILECRRTLTSDGILIISTPNRDVFQRVYGSVFGETRQNPFHVIEFSPDDLLTLLRPAFNKIELFFQRPFSATWWSARALAADSSGWEPIRGFWRLRKLLRDLVSADFFDAPDEPTRANAAQRIALADHPLAGLLNPYEVFRPGPLASESAIYLVAVAKAPRRISRRQT